MLDLLLLEGNDEDKDVEVAPEVARRFNTPIIIYAYCGMSMVLSK